MILSSNHHDAYSAVILEGQIHPKNMDFKGADGFKIIFIQI